MTTGIIFVGGPGRSGTSFVADRIGRHADVATFQDVELKIFGEFGGLLDMQSVLVERFSPNRGEIVFKHFRNMLKALRSGGFGQPSLESLVAAERLDPLVEELFTRLQPDGYITQLEFGTFNEAARAFLQGLARIALDQKPGATSFLEKTPHNCLHPQFLHELAPDARYLHIYRNPKAIAVSLLAQSWGPARLDHSIVWVRSYFDAWLKAKAHFHRLGLPLADYTIEGISADPVSASTAICRHLGLTPDSAMFAGADINQLQGWKKKLADDAYIQLEEGLGPLCRQLRYADENKSVRASVSPEAD